MARQGNGAAGKWPPMQDLAWASSVRRADLCGAPRTDRRRQRSVATENCSAFARFSAQASVIAGVRVRLPRDRPGAFPVPQIKADFAAVRVAGSSTSGYSCCPSGKPDPSAPPVHGNGCNFRKPLSRATLVPSRSPWGPFFPSPFLQAHLYNKQGNRKPRGDA